MQSLMFSLRHNLPQQTERDADKSLSRGNNEKEEGEKKKKRNCRPPSSQGLASGGPLNLNFLSSNWQQRQASNQRSWSAEVGTRHRDTRTSHDQHRLQNLVSRAAPSRAADRSVDEAGCSCLTQNTIWSGISSVAYTQNTRGTTCFAPALLFTQHTHTRTHTSTHAVTDSYNFFTFTNSICFKSPTFIWLTEYCKVMGICVFTMCSIAAMALLLGKLPNDLLHSRA